jgi:hypothetical protein
MFGNILLPKKMFQSDFLGTIAFQEVYQLRKINYLPICMNTCSLSSTPHLLCETVFLKLYCVNLQRFFIQPSLRKLSFVGYPEKPAIVCFVIFTDWTFIATVIELSNKKNLISHPILSVMCLGIWWQTTLWWIAPMTGNFWISTIKFHAPTSR